MIDHRPAAAGSDYERLMKFEIYKSGQGYWTRLLSAIGAGMIVLFGVAWLWGELEVIRENRLYIQAGVSTAVILFFAGLIFYLLNKPVIADFMIATEAEMRKVNWPTRREVVGSTWVVICGTFLMALVLLVVQGLFYELFVAINVLKSNSILVPFFQGLLGA